MYKIDFLNKINEEIADKSDVELKDLIIKLAKQLPNGSYAEVLSWFSTAEGLVQDVDNKVQSLSARLDELSLEIEGGMYEFHWNFEYHYDDYDDDDLIDENGLGKELDVLFEGVMELVHIGEYRNAKQLFGKLFAIEITDDDYEDISMETLFDNDVLRTPYVETLYAYAYCVLRCEQGYERVSQFFEIMDSRGYHVEQFKLEDVLRAGGGALSDESTFCEEWIQYLMGLPSNRPTCKRDVFLLDALTHSGGVSALEKFVSENKIGFSKLGFKLIDLYFDDKRYDDAVVIIYDAFENLKGVDSNKRIFSDYLIEISELVGSQEYFKIGIVEAFRASLDAKYFVEIFRLRNQDLIAEAVDYLRSKKGDASEFDYYAIEFLMGNYELVWKRCAKDKNPLGWSNYGFNSGSGSALKGHLFPLFLGLLSKDRLGKISARLIEAEFCYSAFTELLLQSFSLFAADAYQKYFNWCKAEIENRVVAIVSNQHRGSYYKASALIVAMAEVLMVREGEDVAMSYVKNFKAMFPRHNAFIKCLREDLAVIGRKL